MNRQRSTVNNSNGIFFYLEVPKGENHYLSPCGLPCCMVW
ncbi:hypothetical protein GXM_05741 [Nostoc sphaeroides CCNUC1]|uniref:Uncharacterized protein n=1 Tax=Nostoc sphaeroides CCNUC1 TaxID=2653204 RepID=A0A5P8W8H0_9NOSO|nr:hypothetical protein GXM_05741 [Nostoc sphaeroides CCNUC1]